MSRGEGGAVQHPGLLDALGGAGGLEGRDEGLTETAWVEVVRKMDEVYSDLLRYEVDLEEKNAALEEAQRFISSVLSAMSDVLVVCDPRGRVQEVNRAVLDLTGLPAAAMVGRPVADLLMADEALAARLNALLRGGDVLHDCEVRLCAEGGRMTDLVAINCSTRYDHDGRPAGLVLIGRPVGELRRAYEALNRAHAELKEAQRQLVQQEKMASLGRLVAGVAHELNNPISFIYGNIHALKKYRERLSTYLGAVHGGLDGDTREALRRKLRIDSLLADLEPLVDGTLEGAGRLAEIVRNLRRLSFSAAGEAEVFDLAATVRTAVQWTVKGLRRRVDVALDLPETMPVRGHEGQLHQVMTNLIQNALDATAESVSAAIRIEGREDGDRWRLEVTDNGPGIAQDSLLKVFDPFFTTKAVGQGTGLGLWISYGIVKDHGGALEAANREDGPGARFTLSLPRPAN